MISAFLSGGKEKNHMRFDSCISVAFLFNDDVSRTFSSLLAWRLW